ncbi:hypothetical protein CVT24_001862, partial [Panaeolus cyanescens]
MRRHLTASPQCLIDFARQLRLWGQADEDEDIIENFNSYSDTDSASNSEDDQSVEDDSHYSTDEMEVDMEVVQDFIEDLQEIPYLPSAHSEDPQASLLGEEGPGPQTAANRLKRQAQAYLLDDNDETRYVLQHQDAGQVIAHKPAPGLLCREGYVDDLHDEDRMMDGTYEPGYAPFTSKLDWEVARWAIKTDPGKNGLDRLLQIPGVVEKLGLSFHNSRALYKRLDVIKNKAGEWKTSRLRFNDNDDEEFIVRHRDPLEAIKSLWQDPFLSPKMVFKPVRVYTDKSMTQRIYSEMWTGKWWEFLQKRVRKGGTVCPVIIATDKTQLTQFIGGKSAYPVYLTIGNIPRSIRRKPSAGACILIAYLSVEKVKERPGMTETEQRSKVQRVFHEAMRTVLSPLIDAGQNGVEMAGSDGAVREVFPILTCYVADYPEQCLVACCKYGTCPKCTVTATQLGDTAEYPLRTQKATEKVMKEAREAVADEPDERKRNRNYYTLCMEQDVAGGVWKPFWVGFP